MSFERGIKAINLEMTDEIPQTEMIDHDEFMKKRAGIDISDPEQKLNAWTTLAQKLDFDFIWNILEMPMHGRVTKMGHAVWNEIDTYDNEIVCPFKTDEDVLSFDPVSECQLQPVEKMVPIFQKNFDDKRKLLPNTVVPGGRYHTLFSACIRTFGWDMFLMSVPGNEERFDRVLEGFAEISTAEAEAWARTGIEVYITHDDIVWSNGAVFRPEWYRKYIFPKYKKIWAPLKERGIKIIYCADGDWNEFIDDVADAGADGFIFEPSTSLEYITEKYGQTKVIMGNADCRILQFGTREDIEREIKRCIDLGRNCPGYFMLTSNHIPNGIPLENVDFYFETFERMRKR
jgi:hypothetical protein